MTGPFSLTANGQQTPDLGAPADHDGGVAVQITGTWTGTIEFQVSVDKVNWVQCQAQKMDGTAAALNTTGNGIWRVPSTVVGLLGGINHVRCASVAAWTGAAVIVGMPFLEA